MTAKSTQPAAPQDFRAQLNTLLATLDQEHAALEASNPDDLQAILHRKQEQCAALSQVQAQVLAVAHADPKLEKLLRDCRSKNNRNGLAISERRRVVQQRINEVNPGSCYSAQGTVQQNNRTAAAWQA